MPTSSNVVEASLPNYYRSLAPFRARFAQGNPILIYHKLGPRPRRVRLKGLYVGANLFAAQLGELQAAGFGNGSLQHSAGPFQPGKIVISFDDGYVNVLRQAVAPLAAAGFKAIQFLPANFLGRQNEWDVAHGEAPEAIMDAAQVREWLAAGHDLGSHSLTHPFLTQVPLEQAREEIFASKKKLEDLFGRPIEHFCYPHGDWNEPVRDFVREAGYRTACTTVAGVNDASTSPFALKRFTVRYRSRNWKGLKAWLAERWAARSR